MKVVCSSCGFNYKIPDDRVQGRRVKIRCRNCDYMIKVDGTKPPEDVTVAAYAPEEEDEREEATQVMSAEMFNSPEVQAAIASATQAAITAEPEWSVNLGDDEPETMTPTQIAEGWASGRITSEVYVWREGMGDWVLVQEVPELKAILGPAPAAVAPPAPAALANLTAEASSTKAPDLFADHNLAGSAEDGIASREVIQDPSVESATGARNENSVLFSLDALKAGASRNAGDQAPVQSATPLSDLALLTATADIASEPDNQALLTAPVKSTPPPSSGNLHEPSIQIAPEANKPTSSGGKEKLVLVGGAAIGLLVAAGAFLFLRNRADAPSAQLAAVQPPAAAAAAEMAPKPTSPAAAPPTTAATATAEPPTTSVEDLAKAEPEPKTAPVKAAEAPATAQAAAKAPQSAPATPATTPSPGTPAGSAAAGAAEPAAAEPAAAEPAAPEEKPPFNTSAAKAALSAASGRAKSCKKPDGPTGKGKVQITFSTSGRVTSANVIAGNFGGTTTGGCVARTFRGARVPPFSGNPVTVSKSFRIP
ncbi:MAG: zinc-ribbon domain-containing protein [Polyangiaceae bacterium]|nr:zinc-ribbon domain-containing protein [Polyangiaceae bacterium]